ncbi:unnamed protein product [Phytophthora fragariaefolia]|uniref:Unnamed protein product n=1 Tax=Phytophthora fragariaefolia TaxID=1490495 RepID=A0A9W6XMU1_9STRA|nr:unnamed protein product [Phytophthora fragariaefolia]
MAGDVASAFRNIGIHSNSVYLFAGHIEEDDVIVIELAAPIGWTGSPGSYEIAGGAIAHVHGSQANDVSPTGFFNYHWVDDHINVAADIGTSCDDMDRSLRFAIVAVLGADAINTKKFTNWNTRQRVLGLEFNTVEEQSTTSSDELESAVRAVEGPDASAAPEDAEEVEAAWTEASDDLKLRAEAESPTAMPPPLFQKDDEGYGHCGTSSLEAEL